MKRTNDGSTCFVLDLRTISVVEEIKCSRWSIILRSHTPCSFGVRVVAANFMRFFCHMTCSPDQHSFLEVIEAAPYTMKRGNETCQLLDMNLAPEVAANYSVEDRKQYFGGNHSDQTARDPCVSLL